MATAAVTVSLVSSDRHWPTDSVTQLTPIWGEKTITFINIDHDDDIVLLDGPFPANTYMQVSSVYVDVPLLDSDGTPTTDVAFGFGGVDGAIDSGYNLFGTGDHAAKNLNIDNVTVGVDPYLDISGLYFIMDVVTAATALAADVDVEYGFNITRQVRKYS